MILALTILFACSPSTPEASAPGPANAPAAPVATIDPACVAKADAADGATDGVVQKCAGCTLLMDGDPAHASTHGGATFHSCSDGCKARLDADPGAVLAKACAMR
jgi:hypothetical protein